MINKISFIRTFDVFNLIKDQLFFKIPWFALDQARVDKSSFWQTLK